MRTVIVFESMFGNTEQLAREIAAGLESSGAQVDLADVRNVRPADLGDCDLLVVGAPTHAFSLSRQSTREDAVRQGADPARAGLGVREWLATLDDAFETGAARPRVAVFDSRVGKVRHLPGSAAKRASRVLRTEGFDLVDSPTSFYVVDVKGPVVAGERERARTWGARLADLATARRRKDVS